MFLKTQKSIERISYPKNIVLCGICAVPKSLRMLEERLVHFDSSDFTPPRAASILVPVRVVLYPCMSQCHSPVT